MNKHLGSSFTEEMLQEYEQLHEKLRIATEALEFICTTLVPYAPHSDEGIAIEKAREALAKIQGEK